MAGQPIPSEDVELLRTNVEAASAALAGGQPGAAMAHFNPQDIGASQAGAMDRIPALGASEAFQALRDRFDNAVETNDPSADVAGLLEELLAMAQGWLAAPD